nr:hypothetical protein Iba_chr07bCG7180 [Ipomoea batatas]
MRANTWWFWRDVYPSINLRSFQTVGRLSPGDFGMAMKEGRSARRNNPDLRLYGPAADRSNEAAYSGYIPYQVAPSPQIMTMLVRRGGKMSGSDSQNVSGRDYDEGDEVGNDSYSPSMSGSTFNQIDEVENISADVAEDERQARTPTSTEESISLQHFPKRVYRSNSPRHFPKRVYSRREKLVLPPLYMLTPTRRPHSQNLLARRWCSSVAITSNSKHVS